MELKTILERLRKKNIMNFSCDYIEEHGHILQIIIDETEKAISVTRCSTELPSWTNNDVDSAYLMGCMNVGGIDEISKELKRLEEIGLKPHEAVGKVRGKW